MMESLATLIGLTTTTLAGIFLTFLRIGALMAVLPAFGERSIPERIRLVLAVALTIIVYPAIAAEVGTISLETSSIALAILPEVMAGLLLGLVLRLSVISLQIAGAMLAQSTSLSQIFGGAAVEAQPAIGHILLVAGLALAVMLGLHVRVVELVILSYEIFPVGEFLSPSDVMSWGLSHVTQSFSLAFTLSAPFVIASLIYNVALGVINRAMPQLMVAFVGAPAITLGGLLLLFITAPILLETWRKSLDLLLINPFGGP